MRKMIAGWVLLVFAAMLPLISAALAEAIEDDALIETGEVTYDWLSLGTVAGATAATLLVVQYTKDGIDRVLKFPTRLYVYVVAFVLLLCAKSFMTGLDWQGLPLIALNAVVVASAAYGSYEMTFAKGVKED